MLISSGASEGKLETELEISTFWEVENIPDVVNWNKYKFSTKAKQTTSFFYIIFKLKK